MKAISGKRAIHREPEQTAKHACGTLSYRAESRCALPKIDTLPRMEPANMRNGLSGKKIVLS